MKSEEIIQRLLDEKHINVEEAMVLMKDIVNKQDTQYISTPFTYPAPTPISTPLNPYCSDPTVVMQYGARPVDHEPETLGTTNSVSTDTCCKAE